jgi:hypothetical protein
VAFFRNIRSYLDWNTPEFFSRFIGNCRIFIYLKNSNPIKNYEKSAEKKKCLHTVQYGGDPGDRGRVNSVPVENNEEQCGPHNVTLPVYNFSLSEKKL